MSESAKSNSSNLDQTFEALTGHAPFRWQRRLLGRFLDGDLPLAVDIPTGLGKTSIMALWLIALGGGADLPRRLVYVVDRRVVVDQATHEAERLRAHMTPSLADGLKLGEKGLPISTLRGGFADNRDWLEDPSQPAVVVGTVDMVGSRLLFGGYGVSRGMRPYQAGLLGVDSLVVLDEAHLCYPFESLLREIADGRDDRYGPIGIEECEGSTRPPRFRLLSLSATGRQPSSGTAVFRLEEEDHDDPVVECRLAANKRLTVADSVEDAKALQHELAERALALGSPGKPARVLVYCNRRSDADAVKKLIDRQKAPARRKVGLATELLVGERRVHEREQLAAWLTEHGYVGGSEGQPETTSFLIATSAGEVGIDLDADHMVCDLVACERMVQRLGRVNRRGGDERCATIEVIPEAPKLAPRANDSAKAKHAKAAATFHAWREALAKLPRLADRSLEPGNPLGTFDASPGAFRELRMNHHDAVVAATTPAPLHPALTRPLLEAWAMTSLKNHEGRPEVGPWLRGWEEEEDPKAVVVWRRHLPLRHIDRGTDRADAASVAEFFRCAPVHASEKLEAPASAVWGWLKKRAAAVESQSAVAEGQLDLGLAAALVLDRSGDLIVAASIPELSSLARPKNQLGRDEQSLHDRWERTLYGATLIVDATLCGLSDGLLDEKSSDPVATADEDPRWKERRQGSLHRPLITFRVEAVQADGENEGLRVPELDEGAGEWRLVRTFETDTDTNGRVRGGLAVYNWPDDPTDEEARSVSAPQGLRDHAEQVAQRVRAMAEQLGLPTSEVDALERAAYFHDDGKAARRWQDAMNAPRDDGRPYAKTSGGGDWRLLGGYRHEFGSLLKAERESLPAETRDLILHLIAAHHGNSRPLIATAGCDEGPPTVLAAHAGEAALRFARLQKRYGVWGLAWREAILRAADQSASRDWAEASRLGSSHG